MKTTIRFVEEWLPLNVSGWFPPEDEEIRYWLRIPYWSFSFDYYKGSLMIHIQRQRIDLFPKEKIITKYTYHFGERQGC